MKILFIGDVSGDVGIKTVQNYLKIHRDNYDFVIANGENSANGLGIGEKHFKQLRDAGVDVVTLGNHTWDERSILNFIDNTPRLLRPANFTRSAPGLGHYTMAVGERRVTVISLIGRIFMEPYDNPFTVVDDILADLTDSDIIIVDFHAEATSEKKCMYYHLRGRVTAVLGTHTHVQTADEHISNGTAYLTDVGMTGVWDSSLGVNYEQVLYRLLTQLPKKFSPADGVGTLGGVELTIDEVGKAQSITRVQWRNELAS